METRRLLSGATFLGTDTTTQGYWQRAYGSDGYDMAAGEVSLPAYATVSVTGSISTNTNFWEIPQPGALWQPASDTRLAAQWFTSGSEHLYLDVHLTDGQAHRVSLYAVDRNGTPSETIDVIDDATGSVLDTESASLEGGEYLSWDLTGDVTLKVTGDSGTYPVASGLFFGVGSAGVPPSGTASPAGTDTTTQGNWQPAYGSDGYAMAAGPMSLPSYATVGIAASTIVNPEDENSPGALVQPGTDQRLAAQWFWSSTGSVYMDIHLTDGQAHRVALYVLDLNGTSNETVDAVDDATGSVLDAESVSNFQDGEYLTWDLSGDVTLKVTGGPGLAAVASGLFFDPDPSPAAPSLGDPSFEDTPVGAGSYAVDPASPSWYFRGSSGISSNNSAITSGNPPAPDGNQVAFLQGSSDFYSRGAVGWPEGDYQISFDAAKGANGPNAVGLEVEFGGPGGEIIDTITLTSTNYEMYTTQLFFMRPDWSMTFTFVGLGQSGTALIDNVSVQAALTWDDHGYYASGSYYDDMTVGPDGAAWFTSQVDGVGAAIGRIDPITYNITQYPAVFAPEGMEAGADGGIWLSYGGNSLGRFDPNTHAITSFRLSSDVIAGNILEGQDGALWIAEDTTSNSAKVGRLDPVSGDYQEFSLSSFSGIGHLTESPDGAIWFTGRDDSDFVIGRVDLTTHAISVFPLPADSEAVNIAASPDGAIWFTGVQYNEGKIGRLDPSTGAVEEFTDPVTITSPLVGHLACPWP
jgi:streptogramin lyase